MYFISPKNIQQHQDVEIGGKARNLFNLHHMGLKVPPFVVIPFEVLKLEISSDVWDEGNINKILFGISKINLSDSFIQSIVKYFPSDEYFAVRSSGADEDNSSHSFAGQYQSFLYVTREQLADKIKQVWASAFSERVLTYRKINNIEMKNGVSVIIQKMVNAEFSGVGFGIDPVRPSTNSKIISAVYGLGEGLVSGELDADTYVVENGKISQQVVEKNYQYRLDNHSKSGIKIEDVDVGKRLKPVLSDTDIKIVEELLVRLEKATGIPQDIEFAFENNQIYLLQTRPVTTLTNKPDIEEYIVWDNSNIIESYPGLTTPLTFSFIIKVYEAVYRQFAELMGVSNKEVDKNALVFANMLGLLNGRVYYNLLSWYRALSLLPGYSLNAEFMEKMMGVKERFELKDYHPKSRLQEKIRVADMVITILQNLVRLPGMRSKFKEDFYKVIHEFDKYDFDKKSANELMDLYHNFEQTLLKKWKAPIVNDFFAMIYFGLLQKFIEKLTIVEKQSLHNALLCGQNNIISTEPAHLCVEISEMINQNHEARQLFLQQEAHEIWKALDNDKRFSEINKKVQYYIQKWGDRYVGELKLETVTYKQNPLAFINILKSYVEQKQFPKASKNNSEQILRKEAEKKVSDALKGKIVKKILFKHILKNARDLVSNRENLRYERTKAFGVVREIFLAIGKNFASKGIIETQVDIFYLTKEEIFDFIKGSSVNKDLCTLISLRKAEYIEFEKMSMPERIKTSGIVNSNIFIQNGEATEEEKEILQGLGCCPGKVRGKVKIVKSPTDVKSLDNDILVTSSTDPGWITLFPTASAILVERGSLLSHSAIVSREMGIPCIVGIKGILNQLKSGDMVEMDGTTGEVKILQRN